MKALVIPAYRPSAALLDLIASLAKGEFAAIVVVDDGSGPKYAAMFAQLEGQGVTVARHAVPIGRGAALRAGMHAALSEAPALDSIVLAEECHAAIDIARVAKYDRPPACRRAAGPGDAEPGILALGTQAHAHCDWAARALTGIRVADPWATLRAIPASLVPHLLALESRGAEFDVETVVLAAEHAIPVVEVTIETGPPRVSAAGPLLRFLVRSRPDRAMTRLLAGLTTAVFVAAIAAGIYGFATGHLFRQFVWLPWGLRRLVHFGVLFGAWSLPVLLIFPWAYAPLFAALLLCATARAAGPLAVGAVLFFLLSANALGAVALQATRRRSKAPASPEILNTLLGIGFYAFLMTLTARMPVNYPAAWAAVAALPLALDWRGVMRRLGAWWAALHSLEMANWRERGALALLLFVLSIHWFAALVPEFSADGLAMHLAVPADIAAHRAMTFHPDVFVWSVMPMAADFTYTIVYLLGGEASASLLNFALLAAIAALLYGSARHWLRRDAALIVAALFVSTPLVNLVTGSLFIENFAAAMILGMVIALWRYREGGGSPDLWLAAALGGTAASAKFGACVFVLTALAIAAVEARRRRTLKPALTAAVLLLLFALPPYAIAYAKTGNPVFPFLNLRFPSPLLEHGIEFRNNAYTQPLTWNTPFDLTFHTSRYLEGLNGAIGFQYLLLIPLAAIALFAARGYGARLAAAIALIAGGAVMASQPYARYVYPSMPLLAIPFAALLARVAPRQRPLYHALLLAAIVCIALNGYFTPVSGWHHKDFYPTAIFRSNGRARTIREDIPLRDVTLRFRRQHPQERALLLMEQDLADAGSNAYEYHWHEYGVWKQIASAETVADLRHVFSRLGVRYFISRREGPDDDLLAPSSFAEFIANCTAPQLENGRFYAARITDECDGLSDAQLEAKLEGLPPALVTPGAYDDFDPALRFHGAWTRSRSFDGPYRHSISYTDSPGAEVAFAFQGNGLTYVFTKSANRGIALLEIDGAPHEIDLYGPAPQWRNRVEFCCLGPGPHLAVLRATGRKRPEALDAYIDVDEFIAK